MRESYRVVVTREGRNWLADVPDLEGARTWGRNLPSLDRYVREVIILADDLPDEAGPEMVLDYEYRPHRRRISQVTPATREPGQARRRSANSVAQ